MEGFDLVVFFNTLTERLAACARRSVKVAVICCCRELFNTYIERLASNSDSTGLGQELAGSHFSY